MFKSLHPLERWGFLGMVMSVLLLATMPIYIKDPNIMRWIVWIPFFLCLLFGGMMLTGQQYTLKKSREKMNKAVEGMQGIIASLESLRNTLHTSAERLRDRQKDSTTNLPRE